MGFSEPLYKTISNDLKYKIKNGEYIHGDILPTEAKLSKKYYASRVTIRKALQILMEENYVKKIQGSGTHVIYSPHHFVIERGAKVFPFFEEISLMNKTPSAKVVKFEMIHGDFEKLIEICHQNMSHKDDIKKTAQNEKNEWLHYYERVLYCDNTALCFEKGWMPLKFFPDLSVEAISGSRLNYIEKKGIFLKYSHQILEAISADERLSSYLNVPASKPLLKATQIDFDKNDIAIEKIETIYNSEVYRPAFIKTKYDY